MNQSAENGEKSRNLDTLTKGILRAAVAPTTGHNNHCPKNFPLNS